MTNELGIEVINFVASVMHSSFRKHCWSSNEKEAVMVDVFVTKVKVEEAVHVLIFLGICKNIRRHEVEMRGVEINVLIKILGDITKVSQLMNKCRAMLESLKLPW